MVEDLKDNPEALARAAMPTTKATHAASALKAHAEAPATATTMLTTGKGAQPPASTAARARAAE